MSMDQGKYYVIRDMAGNIYGPATLPLLKQWVMEGRVTAQMMVALQGTAAFVPAGQMPELADTFSPMPAAGVPASGYAGGQHYAAQAYGTQPYYSTMPLGQNQGMAIASLVCGIMGFVMCGLLAILAVIFGHIARGQIQRDPDRYGGGGMALAGLIIGYIQIGLLIVVVAFFIIVAASGGFH